MKGIRARAVGEHKSVVQEMREGWNYVFSSPAIRWILILLAIVNLAGAPYSVLMPIVAGGILKGGPHTLGFLMAASGVGALISAISLAIRKTVIGLGKMIAISTVLFGASLVLLGVSHWVWLSMVVMLGAGFGLMQQMAASNTILQTIVEDNKRGRVMAFYTMAVLGITPFGSLLAGSFANRFGAPATLVYGGLICLGGGIWFARQLPELRRVIRPVYVQLGIIPELASGVQSASALPMPPQG
jgi:MFS family permease